MSNGVLLDVKCGDFLKNNPRLYARKAKRKKIALIEVDATNRHPAEIKIALGSAKLDAGNQIHDVEAPSVIIRKFTEFTWDFVVYAILDFHPWLVVVDTFFFLTGPLYNRRLKKQLCLLSDGEMVLGAGEKRKAILGFRNVSTAPAKLSFSYRHGSELLEACCIIQ